MQFIIPRKQWFVLKKEVKSKKYVKELIAEIKGERVAIKPDLMLGTFTKEMKKDLAKRLVAFRLSAINSVDYEELFKIFPSIQKRVDCLKQYGIKDFEATVCGEFNFSLKVFNTVGQLSLPANLPLKPELAERLGRTTLTGFGISFENSPLGLRKAIIEFEEKGQILSVTLNSSFQSASMDKIIFNAYRHITDIAKLFVVKKNEYVR